MDAHGNIQRLNMYRENKVDARSHRIADLKERVHYRISKIINVLNWLVIYPLYALAIILAVPSILVSAVLLLPFLIVYSFSLVVKETCARILNKRFQPIINRINGISKKYAK